MAAMFTAKISTAFFAGLFIMLLFAVVFLNMKKACATRLFRIFY